MYETNKGITERSEAHLRDYLRVIQKRKAIVILFFVVTVFLVMAATLIMKPVYEASTQVLVEKNDTTSLTSPAFSSRFDFDFEFYTTQLELIKSQNVARKVVKNLNLEETYSIYFPETGNTSFLLAQIPLDKFLQTSIDNLKRWILEIIIKFK